MERQNRVPPSDARKKAESGEGLIVCAYDDDDELRKIRLDGSISLSDFRSRVADLQKEQVIIFYCA